MVAESGFVRRTVGSEYKQKIVFEPEHVLGIRVQGRQGSGAGIAIGENVWRQAFEFQGMHDELACVPLFDGVSAEGSGNREIAGECVPLAPQGLISGIAGCLQSPTHFVGIPAAGLDFQPTAGDASGETIIFR